MKLFTVYSLALIAVLTLTSVAEAAPRERSTTVETTSINRDRGDAIEDETTTEDETNEEDRAGDSGVVLNISYSSTGGVQINYENNGDPEDDANIEVTINGQSTTNNGGNGSSGNNESSDGENGTDGADGTNSDDDTEKEADEPHNEDSEEEDTTSDRRDSRSHEELDSRR